MHTCHMNSMPAMDGASTAHQYLDHITWSSSIFQALVEKCSNHNCYSQASTLQHIIVYYSMSRSSCTLLIMSSTSSCCCRWWCDSDCDALLDRGHCPPCANIPSLEICLLLPRLPANHMGPHDSLFWTGEIASLHVVHSIQNLSVCLFVLQLA